MVGPGTFLARMSRMVSRTSISGHSNLDILDQPGPALIVVNHTTVVDVIVVIGSLHRLGFTTDGPCAGTCTHRRHIRPVGTSDMWDFPVAKQVCTGSGIIPTDQHDGRAAYRAALAALRNNEVVLIYPEGDVKINDEASPRSWRPGASGLAKAAKMPVVPIVHHDTRKLGNGTVKRSILMSFASVFRRPKIKLHIGAHVHTGDLDHLSISEVTVRLEETLFDTWMQLTGR